MSADSSEGLVKILIDGAWHKDTLHAATACFAYDEKKTKKTSQGEKRMAAMSATVVEAKACLEAVQWCVRAQISKVAILTDSLLLVRSLQEKIVMEN